MRKRKPSLSDNLLADVWNVQSVPLTAGALQGFDKIVAAGVGRCLNEDARGRDEIASLLSSVLGEDVSVNMLNAYSSESRREHPSSVYRFLALIAVTGRFDILDAIVRQIGAKALDQSDLRFLKIGKAYTLKLEADRKLATALGGDQA